MPAQIARTHYSEQQHELTAEQNHQAPLSHGRNVAFAGVHIIIPVLNEARALEVVLPSLPVEVLARTVVVDNGSTDESGAVAQDAGVRVVREPRRGYGSACLAGIAALQAAAPDDIVIFMDGDASDDVADLPALIEPIRADQADLVIGSRVLGARDRGALSPHARFGNWLATALIFRKLGVRYTDLGPLRAIRFSALRKLDMRDRGFGWTVEMQLKAVHQNLRIREVPARYHRRIGRSKISGTLSGSVRAGITILKTIARYGA